ncbi:MAG TPA: hypothetical protein VJ906_09435, partial [Roseovarius sp.]|nr:hypothetical protein [Roseovarius sp.]
RAARTAPGVLGAATMPSRRAAEFGVPGYFSMIGLVQSHGIVSFVSGTATVRAVRGLSVPETRNNSGETCGGNTANS